MHLGWFRQRWPALLALVACTLVGVRLGTRRPHVPDPSEQAALALFVSSGADRSAQPDAGTATAARLPAGGGAPLAGARVRVIGERGGTHRRLMTLASDAAGRAHVSVAPGSYWVLVDAPGYARRSGRARAERGTAELRFDLPRAEPLRVSVADGAGRPLSGATVQVRDGDLLAHAAVTSADGIARFEHVDGAVESVGATAPGHDAVLAHPATRQVELTLSALASLDVQVRAPSGAPASGAEVWVSGAGRWPPLKERASAAGVARFHGLAPGSYELRAELGAWVSDAVSPVLLLEPGGRQRLELALAEGSFVSVRVVGGGGPRSPPIAGALVTLVESGLSPFPRSASTDEAGRCRFGPLAAESALLGVRADGYMSESLRALPRSQPEVTVALVRSATLTGRVLDPEGHPIEGARLEVVGDDARGRPIAARASGATEPRPGLAAPPLVPMGELGVLVGPLPVPGMPPPGPAPSSAWVTDLDGRHRLDGIPPGRLRLLARHPDFMDGTSEPISVAPGGSAEATLVLQRGAEVAGRVIDARGRPVAKARVEARSSRATRSIALTGGDGGFELRGLPARVELLLARPGERGRFALRAALELSPGERRELELELPERRGPLTVVTLGEADRPLAGAAVSLSSLDPEVPFRLSSVSDARGESAFADVAGVPALLRVQAPGWQSFETEIEMSPERVEIALVPSLTVTGRVLEGGGRGGLAGAEVVLLQDGERRSTVADENGEFELPGLARGPATLSVRHPDFSETSRDLILEPGALEGSAQRLAPILLEPSGAAAGWVVDDEGLPVPGARVGLGLVPAFVPAGRLPSGFVETDAAGRFELRGLAPGLATLSAYASGFGRGSAEPVRIEAGERSEGIEIRLGRARVEAEPAAAANVAVTLGERRVGAELEVVIVNVAPGSEAERAGVRAGDILWSVDDEVVGDMDESREALGGGDGSDVILELEREGQTRLVRVRREAVH